MTSDKLNRQLLDLFAQEVKQRATEIERHLMVLEGTPDLRERRSRQEGLLRASHSLKGAAGLVKARSVEAICHKMEDLLSFLGRHERLLEKEDLNVLFAATDMIAGVGETLERQGSLTDMSVESLLARIEARLRSGAEAPANKQDSSADSPGSMMPGVRRSDIDGSMRLSGDKLDTLLYQSGELVSAKSRLNLRAEQSASLQQRIRSLRASPPDVPGEAVVIESGLRALTASIAEDARLIGGLISEFDYEIRRARMQPFAEICQGIPRLVREIGKASDKSAELRVDGGDIEIDRSIATGLQDALRHLVRNAMGHGIEAAAERRAAGKPETGSIIVSAALNGDRLQVRVADDGRGFDVDSISKAADRLGLPEATDERQRLRHAFEAGVSTSSELTTLSGRGVGLDIVRKAVEGMRGIVEVSHVAGKGAAFTLILPLTLTTVQALEIIVAGQNFTIDTASVRRVARISAKNLPRRGAPNVVAMEEGPVRVLDLADWLGLPRRMPVDMGGKCPVVIVGPPGSETAIIVEQIVGQQELLARSLGKRLSNLRCYSGATVLPDGRIAPLLNVAALVGAASLQENFASETFSFEQSRRKRRVLVVDDVASVRALQKLILEEAGYEVSLAGDGRQALKHLRAHGADLVLADIDMPVMDGLALTQAIRRSRKFANLPVILVTGRDTPEEKAEGLRVGATAYVAKSAFDQQEFLQTVGRVM